jgi:hypothetical protein
MLQIAPQQTILLAVKPVDFRKGIDSLAAVCRAQLLQDPFPESFSYSPTDNVKPLKSSFTTARVSGFA